MEFPIMELPRLALLIHLLGFALGVGGAFTTDTLFFRFLKDLRISKWEARVMNTLSKVLWTGVTLLVLSGVWLFSMNMERYLDSPRFLAKMTVVFVIILNGVILHFYFSPRLHKLSYAGHPKLVKKDMPLRIGAFASGAVSMTSWLYALLLAWIKWRDVSYFTYIGIYILCLLGAVTVSLFIDKYLERKAAKDLH
jgi:uncharacterized membrane protein